MISEITVAEIEQLLVKGEADPQLLAAMAVDRRKGVRELHRRWQQRQQKMTAEYERLRALVAFDQQYLPSKGYLAGADEVGRGPLAGPVVAAAVILPMDVRLPLGLDDSKQIAPARREALATRIKDIAVNWSVALVSAPEIDRLNIHRASLEAISQAVKGLVPQPKVVLVDGIHSCDWPGRQVTLVKGDATSAAIAAASIIAKVERDTLMKSYAGKFFGYALEKHFGYPTKEHKEAIRRLGVTELHRKTFSGVKEWV